MAPAIFDAWEWPVKIAHVHAADLGGGAERSVISLHRALLAAGHESRVFVGERRTDEPGVFEIPYVRGVPGARRLARAIEHRLGWQDIYNPSFRALSERLADVDVVHFHSLWGSQGYADLAALPRITARAPGVLTLRDEWMLTGHCACSFHCQRWRSGCGACPDLAIPPAVTTDGTAFNWRRKKRFVGRSRLHIVAISEHLKSLAEASPILAQHPVSRIYNGIDLTCFLPLDVQQRNTARLDLGFGADEYVVIIAGQTVEGIRQTIASRHAIAALNALAPRLPALRVLAIGHSAERVGAAIDAPVRCLPFQTAPTAMARLFALADVCLVTSEAEAFGRIAAEAQACGTPVVALAVGGIPEVVVDGIGGIVVPPSSPNGLTDALHKLADDRIRRDLAAGGLAHVRRHFDQRRVADAYLGLYQQVAERGSQH
mgnify:CR=1 FL=1